MTLSNLAPLADAYAALKLEAEKIDARVSELRKEIVDAAGDADEIVGDTCVLAIDDRKGAETLDKAATIALLKQLGATPDQIAALTKVGKSTKVLRIKPLLSLAA